MTLYSSGNLKARRRIDELQAALAALPTMVGDDDICDCVSVPPVDPDETFEVAAELFRRVGPALVASHNLGVRGWQFCLTRGIARAEPKGVFDRLAFKTALKGRAGHHTGQDVYLLVDDSISLKDHTEGTSVQQFWREKLALFLVVHLYETKFPTVRTPTSDSGLPIFSADEGHRMLRLIEPLQINPDPDLPMLAWVERERDLVLTSWPKMGIDEWTPVDVGLPAPYEFLLAHPERAATGEFVGEQTAEPGVDAPNVNDPGVIKNTPRILKRNILGGHRQVPHSTILESLTGADGRDYASRESISKSLYTAIQRPLLASTFMGAATLRTSRSWGEDTFVPKSPIDAVATLASYDSYAEIPAHLRPRCARFTPESPRYDFAGYSLKEGLYTGVGLPELFTILSDIMFILVEDHGIETLRQHQFTIQDIPVLSREESEGLTALTAPLEMNDFNLPILLWRTPSGAIQTMPELSGQTRTKLDTLMLATDPEVRAMMTDGQGGELKRI